MIQRIHERYVMSERLAAGATASVHVGRLIGAGGFGKIVAIKRLHGHLAGSEAFRSILVEEARLASRISHPNVVQVLDVVESDGELFLVLEYVSGETLRRLVELGGRPPTAVAVAIVRDILKGLHAAHHARSTSDEPLELVHRDVTPRNVMVSTEGVAKVLDFGIAKALGRESTTRDGHVRGTLAYMAPEQLVGAPLTARTDLHACAIILWELLTGERLFVGQTEAAVTKRALDHDVRAPSQVSADVPAAFDAVVLRALARDPEERYATGLEMALAMERCAPAATALEVADWVARAGRASLDARAKIVAAVEAQAADAVTTGAEPRPAPSRRRWVAAFTMAAAAAALLWWRYSERSPSALSAETALDAPGVRPAQLSSAAAAFEPPTDPGAAPPPAHAGSSGTFAAPPAVTSTTPPASTIHGVTARRSSAAIVDAPPSTPPSGAPPKDCVPYHLDDAGRRRFQRDCLR